MGLTRAERQRLRALEAIKAGKVEIGPVALITPVSRWDIWRCVNNGWATYSMVTACHVELTAAGEQELDELVTTCHVQLTAAGEQELDELLARCKDQTRGGRPGPG